MNNCDICGEPMPENEQMFKFHGYSGPCPKPPLLQPHQQRVVTEKKELDEKIDKLSVFIKGDIYKNLPGAEQMRLNIQLQAMNGYSNVLGERINAFKE
jgi:hypothetical protein